LVSWHKKRAANSPPRLGKGEKKKKRKNGNHDAPNLVLKRKKRCFAGVDYWRKKGEKGEGNNVFCLDGREVY